MYDAVVDGGTMVVLVVLVVFVVMEVLDGDAIIASGCPCWCTKC